MGNENSSRPTHYPSKDLCERFDISGSTLRKWCIALEKNGCEFPRTEQNRRLFTDREVDMLHHLKELIQDKRMNLENAAIIVGSKYKSQYDDEVTRSYTGTPSVRENDDAHSDDATKILEDHIERQEQFNQELLRRLDEQNEYINKRLDKQDEQLQNRDENLMETMNQMLEERKNNNKMLEEVKEEQKKGLFSRIFGKKR